MRKENLNKYLTVIHDLNPTIDGFVREIENGLLLEKVLLGRDLHINVLTNTWTLQKSVGNTILIGRLTNDDQELITDTIMNNLGNQDNLIISLNKTCQQITNRLLAEFIKNLPTQQDPTVLDYLKGNTLLLLVGDMFSLLEDLDSINKLSSIVALSNNADDYIHLKTFISFNIINNLEDWVIDYRRYEGVSVLDIQGVGIPNKPLYMDSVILDDIVINEWLSLFEQYLNNTEVFRIRHAQTVENIIYLLARSIESKKNTVFIKKLFDENNQLIISVLLSCYMELPRLSTITMVLNYFIKNYTRETLIASEFMNMSLAQDLDGNTSFIYN